MATFNLSKHVNKLRRNSNVFYVSIYPYVGKRFLFPIDKEGAAMIAQSFRLRKVKTWNPEGNLIHDFETIPR